MMANEWVIQAGSDAPVERVGGKGKGLFSLVALGLPVPPFVILSAEAFAASCPKGRVPHALPTDVDAALDHAWAMLHPSTEQASLVSLAVRSSAVEEDSADRSYAGQMDTFLNVTDRAGLSRAVLGCWRSLTSPRATAYREAGQFPASVVAPSAGSMAVVIQQMVFAESAGVAFTANPVTGAVDELVISSVFGLGEGLVDGTLEADTFVLDESGQVKSRRLVEKRVQVVPQEGGTRRAATPPEKVNAPSLGGAELAQLAKDCRAAERRAGRPLDIEFAVVGGKVWYLQARPITTKAKPPGGGASTSAGPGERQIWDNSNIIESYPGITLPLTYSFIRRAYRAVYWQFCRLLGLGEGEIRRRESMLQNMLGLIRGRVYYNLSNWYRLVGLLPSFRINKSFMEGMMGVRRAGDIQPPPLTWRQRYFVELPRLVRVSLHMVWLHATLGRRIGRFHHDFDQAYQRFNAIDYNRLRPADIMRQYHAIEEAVLWHWQAPIINDFAAMIFCGGLKRVIAKWGLDADGSLANGLVARQGGIQSTEVIDRLREMARLIGTNPRVAEDFVTTDPSKAAGVLSGDSACREALDDYLDRYGDRCIAELKLESPTFRDDPSLLMAMLQNFVRARDFASPACPESQRPRDIHRGVMARLRGQFTRFGLPRTWVMDWIVCNARSAIRNRENQRLARTRAYGIVRRMFRAMGRRLAADGVLADPADVFYLELAELDLLAKGKCDGATLRRAVHERRSIYDRYRQMPDPPEHIDSSEPTQEDGSPALDSGVVAGSGAENTLTGLGASPGVVEGQAIVLLNPDQAAEKGSLVGRILVARQTDPGWVVLFPFIRGLVVERGSMLSHSAIVAREMGIPAVVGVRGAAGRIRTGDRVRLDGARGVVEIVASSGEAGGSEGE